MRRRLWVFPWVLHSKKTGIQLAHLVAEAKYHPELFDKPKASVIHVDKIVDEINRRLSAPKNPVITPRLSGYPPLREKLKAERHSPHYTTDWHELPLINI
jgi:hypothetical protein